MSDEIKYINYDETLNIYHRMIDASDGGFEGVRDEGGILATFDFMQNDLYYPSFADKLSYLVFKFCALLLLLELISYIKMPITGRRVFSCDN